MRKGWFFCLVLPVILWALCCDTGEMGDDLGGIAPLSFTTPRKIYSSIPPGEGEEWSQYLDPHLAVGTGGNLYLVLNKKGSGGTQPGRIVFGQSGDQGENWHGLRDISPGYDAAIALHHSGRVHVVYPQCCPWALFHVQSADDGENWGPPTRITEPGINADCLDPVMFVDGTGDIHVAWNQRTLPDGNWEIHYNRSRDHGNTWFTLPVKISFAFNQDCTDPTLVSDGNGGIYLAYSQVQVYFCTSQNYGNNWSAPEDIHPEETQTETPQMSGYGTSSLDLVWVRNRHWSKTSDIIFTRSPEQGRNWTGTLNISDTPGRLSERPVTVAGDNGYIYVAWMEQIGENWEIFLLHSADEGKNWSDAVNVSNTAGNSSVPTIGIDADGTVYLVWDEETAGRHDIYFARSR